MNEFLLILSSVFLTLGCVSFVMQREMTKKVAETDCSLRKIIADLSSVHNNITETIVDIRKDISDLQVVNNIKKRGSE